MYINDRDWASMNPSRDFHRALHLVARGLVRNRPLGFWRIILAGPLWPRRACTLWWSMVISGEGVLTRGRGGGGATTTTTTTTTTDPACILMVPPPPDDGNCWFDQIIGIGWSILDQFRHSTLRNGNHCMTKIYVLDLIMRNSVDMTMKKRIKRRAHRWHNLLNSKTWYMTLWSLVSAVYN